MKSACINVRRARPKIKKKIYKIHAIIPVGGKLMIHILGLSTHIFVILTRFMDLKCHKINECNVASIENQEHIFTL